MILAQEKYGFFNSTVGDEHSYDSADMAAALRTLASSGVADLGTCLAVTAEGSTMRTLIGYGSAMVEGYYYLLQDDGGGIRAFEHTTEAVLNRIDRIILRLDLTARTVAMVKLIGTAGSTPAAPALTRDSETYELSLARVFVQAGAAEILPADITDERADDDLCGLIAPESLRRSEIEALIEAEVDAAIAESEAGFADVLRYSAQTLDASQKTQARANVDAQQRIAASGMLKGDGSGGVSAGAAGTDYAVPVTEISATATVAGWVGSAAPYYQNVTVNGITLATKGISVGLATAATDIEYAAALAALLRVSGQGTNNVTLRALGVKPSINLPLLVQIKG